MLNILIVRKYGEEEGGWCFGASSKGYGVGLWKAIRQGWKDFNKRIVFRVGNGRRVRFWKDKWCGEDTLGEAFPQLYSIAFVKDPWVDQIWE